MSTPARWIRFASLGTGRHRFATAVFATAILARLALPASAAATTIDPRLGERLDAETASAVGELVEEARVKGLPVDALISRALEGASRQAPGPRIVAAVRNLAVSLETAREMLG